LEIFPRLGYRALIFSQLQGGEGGLQIFMTRVWRTRHVKLVFINEPFDKCHLLYARSYQLIAMTLIKSPLLTFNIFWALPSLTDISKKPPLPKRAIGSFPFPPQYPLFRP